MNMELIASSWPACLLACLLIACALALKIFSISLFRQAGGIRIETIHIDRIRVEWICVG